MFQEAELQILVLILERLIKKHGDGKYITLGMMLNIINEARGAASEIRENATVIYESGIEGLKKNQ